MVYSLIGILLLSVVAFFLVNYFNQESSHEAEEVKPPTTQEQLDMPSQVEESLEETVIEQEEEPVEETMIEQETTEAIEPEDMNEQMGIFEYSTYTNSRFGFSVEYPTSFKVGQPPTNNDGRRFFNEEATILAFGRNINILEDNETIDKYYRNTPSPSQRNLWPIIA